jgi:hypothetical protein
MSGASDYERLLGYARTFELAVLADAWPALEPWFADGARHRVHAAAPLGADDRGREAVIAGLRASVHGMDRRFDARIPEVVEGPCTRHDGVWMRYTLRLRRAGLPELALEGEHLARFERGRIAHLEEWLAPGSGERAAAYLAEHDAALRPPAAPVLAPPPDPRDARELDAALGRSLVRFYGGAKSEQDVGAALSVCSEDFALETVAMGLRSRDKKQAERQLQLFFAAFPDYAVAVEGIAAGDGAASCWGRARMTWRGAFGPHPPSGRSVELPFASVFPYVGGALAGERFFFDLAALCEGIGLPLGAAQETLAALRAAEEAT